MFWENVVGRYKNVRCADRYDFLIDRYTFLIDGYDFLTDRYDFLIDGYYFLIDRYDTLGYFRIQHLHKIILSPTDQSDDIDFVEKNVTVFAHLIQYLDDISLSIVIRDALDNGRKALTILREHYLSKRKAESYFPLYRANIFEKIRISLLQTI